MSRAGLTRAAALLLRAELLQSHGRMDAALADLDEALSLAPEEAALHELRGQCLFHRKDYEAAAAAFTRGLAAAPRDQGLLRRRANALWLGGRAAEAARDMAACAPGSDFQALRFEAALGLKSARRGVAKLARSRRPVDRADAAFLRGLLEFREGRYLPAARAFAAAKAGEYEAMARGFEFMKKRGRTYEKGKKAGLVLTGLGLDYPYQATLEALKALSECDILVNNLAGAEAMEFLGLFCEDVRTISFEGRDAKAWSDKVFGWLKPGKRVAFVTRGHPLVSGHLALELIERARREKVEVRCYSAISSVDQMLSLTHELLSETTWGVQVVDSQLLVGGRFKPQSGLPALVYLALPGGSKEHRGQARLVTAALKGVYKGSQRVLVFGPRYDVRELREVRLDGLEAFLGDVEPVMYSSLILLLPPAVPLAPARRGERLVQR